MNHLEMLLRDTLHDDGLTPTAPPDLAVRARKTAQREQRVRQGLALALCVLAVSGVALVASSHVPRRQEPALSTAPSPSALPVCAGVAGSAETSKESDALRADVDRALTWTGTSSYSLSALPPCDDPGAPVLPYRRTGTLARAIANIPTTARSQTLVISRTTYDPSPTSEQLLANSEQPPLLERTAADGSPVLVYVRANPAQEVRVAVCAAPDGVTVTVEMPPQGTPLAYALSVDAAANLAETLVRLKDRWRHAPDGSLMLDG